MSHSDTKYQLLADFNPHPDICVRLLERHGPSLTATLAGQLRLEGSARLLEFLVEQFDRHHPQCLILDCAELSFVDSQGLSMLLQLHKACRNVGIELSLRDPNPFLRDLLRLTRIDTYFHIY